jgi:intracellular multiplication protein IcmO
MTNTYLDTKSSSFEKRARVDLLDLKDQTEGEAHIFFRSQIVRANMFYAAPKPVKKLKVNQFLKVEPPPDDYIQRLQTQLKNFQQVILSAEVKNLENLENETITIVTDSIKASKISDPIERGVEVLMAFHNYSEPEPVEELVENEVQGQITIFSNLRQSSRLPPILAKDVKAFSEPLLLINEARDSMIAIERLAGEKATLAATNANETIKNLQIATSYPPENVLQINSQEITEVVHLICEKIKRERKRSTS